MGWDGYGQTLNFFHFFIKLRLPGGLIWEESNFSVSIFFTENLIQGGEYSNNYLGLYTLISLFRGAFPIS